MKISLNHIAKILNRAHSTIALEVNKWGQSKKIKYSAEFAYW